MIQGAPKFDGLVVAAIEASFLKTTLELKARAAFVSTRTGNTHGWTEHAQWSPAVVAKLQELRELMERELAAVHFDGAELTAAGSGVTIPPSNVGGLAEHLSDAPQV